MKASERPVVRLVVPTEKQPKLHHLVPQFYLERFAENGKVEAVDRDNFSKFFPVTPRNVLAENHFYAIETDDGRDLTIEKLFANHVEGPAANAFERLVDQGRPVAAPGSRAPISLFLAFQFVRGRRIRDMLVEHQKEVIRRAITMASPGAVRKVLQEQGTEISEEDAAEIVEFARDGQYELVVERAANLHLSTSLSAALEIAPLLEARAWQLVEFDEPALLTCDEPVILVGRDPRSPGDTPGGFAMAREIVFPTDPHHALILVNPDQGVAHGRARAGQKQAEIINRHVAFNAHRFIVRRPGTNLLEGLVVPKKAQSVFVAGDVIAMQPHASEASRAKVTFHRGSRDPGTLRRRAPRGSRSAEWLMPASSGRSLVAFTLPPTSKPRSTTVWLRPPLWFPTASCAFYRRCSSIALGRRHRSRCGSPSGPSSRVKSEPPRLLFRGEDRRCLRAKVLHPTSDTSSTSFAR
jgi:hypothetical protein